MELLAGGLAAGAGLGVDHLHHVRVEALHLLLLLPLGHGVDGTVVEDVTAVSHGLLQVGGSFILPLVNTAKRITLVGG